MVSDPEGWVPWLWENIMGERMEQWREDVHQVSDQEARGRQ